jgi:acyl transferase domain-containing protein/thioesterase domain-containing protein/acyl carrier protein
MNSAPVTQGLSGIAIIGMAGSFPGARNVTEFWRNLRDGIESITFFTDEELQAAGIEPALLNYTNYVKAKGLVEGIDLFDAEFFGFSPKEAEIMDPQQRLFLECAWEALENAGYSSDSDDGLVGVYGGAGINRYCMNLLANREDIQSVGWYGIVNGNEKDHLTTRVSYLFDLRGPSFAVQSACSTSLVAIHIACQELMSYQCDLALAGGVAVDPQQKAGYLWIDGLSSPDGHCRAFDARANGFVSGNGVGVVVLKRLAEAVAEGDHIYAVIKGSAVNNDGHSKAGYVAPGLNGQTGVIAMSQAAAEVDPETIDYIEAHGTATPLGDMVEIAALNQVFRASTNQRGFCAIGSLKTNIGHLDAAAGVAGVIKTALALTHRQIPPSLHFEEADPRLDLADSPFYVNCQLKDWVTEGRPRRAGVSSMGMGGTNAHLILEEAPIKSPSSPSRSHQLLTLSAKTGTALEQMIENLADHLGQQTDENLADIAYTLQVGRKNFAHRAILVSDNREDAVVALKTRASGRLYYGTPQSRERRIIFMFPGQGTQYLNMGRGLYSQETVFRDQIDHCSMLLLPHLGFDLREILYPKVGAEGEADQQLSQTWITQVALFVIEFSLAKLWMTWGIHPQAMIGHSIGEYVAACLAGVLTLEESLELVAARGRLMQQLPGGAMLAVPLTEPEIRSLMGLGLSIAAINAPAVCIVSGPFQAIEQLECQLATRGVSGRRLRTTHAFHSDMMDPILESFAGLVKKTHLKPPQIPYLSNVTGNWITEAEATDPNYWARHLRQTVRFSDGLKELKRDSNCLLLEVGPGRTLSSLAKSQINQRPELPILSTLRAPSENQSDLTFLLTTLGRLWLSNMRVDWQQFYRSESRHRVPLPTYPFERRRYWIEARPKSAVAAPLGAEREIKEIEDWFYTPCWKRSTLLKSNAADQSERDEPVCLVFVDPYGMGAGLARALCEEGKKVISIQMGDRLRTIRNDLYEVNPGREEDYQELLGRVIGNGKSPGLVVHLWGMMTEARDSEAEERFRQVQERGFNSLLFLARALFKREPTIPLRLVVVCNQLQDVSGAESIDPAKAIIGGLCMVIPQEYANVECRCIDVVVPTAGTAHASRLQEQLLDEVNNATQDLFIAYRGEQRWVQTLEPIELKADVNGKRPWREGGVYLITGGLGKVGGTLALYLAQSLRANLLLVVRRGLPQRAEWESWIEKAGEDDEISVQIRRVQAMEAYGSRVEVMSADVANEREMQAVIARIYEQFGQLHGVVYAASVSRSELIEAINRQECERQLRAKVYGLYVLERVLRGREVDCCLLLSSNVSILGGLGQAVYGAANRFMDSFAAAHNRHGNNYWVSTNWDEWLMPGAGERPKKAFTSLDQFAMQPEESCECFRRIAMGASVNQVVVSRKDLLPRYDLYIRRRSTMAEADGGTAAGERRCHPRPALSSSYLAPRNEIERLIAEIWQEFLGVEQIGIEDNFFELGGHSLLAIQFFAWLRNNFQIEIPVRHIFNSPTVAQMAMVVQEILPKLEQTLAKTEQINRRPGSYGSGSPVVELQAGGTNPPFFCVHGAGGGVLYFAELANLLGRDQPFYGLQTPGLDGASGLYTSIEEMAARYLESILQIQPTGPYFLGGYSMGGLVSYEIAQQLKAKGEELSLLALLDTSFSSPNDPIEMDDAVTIVALMGPPASLFLKTLRQIEPDQQLSYALEQGRMANLIPSQIDLSDAQLIVEVTKANALAARHYLPRPYSGRLTLFQAMDDHPLFPTGNGTSPDHASRWKKLALSVDLHEIPGNHYTILRQPQVQVVAEKLGACLMKAQQSGSQ